MNGSPVVTESLIDTFYTGRHTDYTFSQLLNLNQPGQYTITSSASVAGDQNSNNNSAVKVLTNSSVSLPQSVDFTDFAGTNLTSVFPEWREATGSVPAGTTSMWSSRTGLGNPSNITARINFFTSPTREWIIGPVFNTTQYTQLTFDAALTGYNNFNTYSAGMPSADAVIVKISTDCGTSWSDLFTINNSNKPSNALTPYVLNLASYQGESLIVAFFASRTSSSSADYDFHIDNILIKDYPPIDPAVVALETPANDDCLGNNETVSVQVMNFGLNDIDFSVDPLSIHCEVNRPNGLQLIDTLINSGTLASGQGNIYSVGTGIDLSMSGTYYFECSVTMLNDGNLNNNLLTAERINNVLPVVISGAPVICSGNSVSLGVNIVQMTPGPITTLMNNTSGTITDNNTAGINRTISVTGASQLNAAEIISVKVNINHSFTGDLILKLTAPNGSNILLSNRRGGSEDNYVNTEFRMDAATSIANGTAPFSFAFLPDEPFTNLTGPANGNWVFNVSDRASGDEGTFQNWSITFRLDNQIVSYEWSTGETFPSITVAPVLSQYYYVTITDANGCQSIAGHDLTVINATTLSLGNDTSVCQGQSVTFDAGSGNTSVVWHDNSVNQTYTATTTENVYVEVSNICGTFRDTVFVTVHPLPVVDIGNDTTLCVNETVQLDAGQGFSGYFWSTGEQTQQISLTSPTPLTSQYVVTVTDGNGCQGIDTIGVMFEICTSVSDVQSDLFVVYPNPASDIVYIRGSMPELETMCLLYDASGRIIDVFRLPASGIYDVSRLPQGLYLLIFTVKSEIVQKNLLQKY